MFLVHYHYLSIFVSCQAFTFNCYPYLEAHYYGSTTVSGIGREEIKSYLKHRTKTIYPTQIFEQR